MPEAHSPGGSVPPATDAFGRTRARSGRTQVLGILMVVFASLGLLESAAQVWAAAGERPPAHQTAQGTLMDAVVHGDPRLPSRRRRLRWIAGLSGLLVSALHLAAGLVALTRSGPGGSGRALRLGYAALAPLRAVVLIVLAQAWLAPLSDGGILRGPGAALRWQLTALALLSAVWAVVAAVLLRRSPTSAR